MQRVVQVLWLFIMIFGILDPYYTARDYLSFRINFDTDEKMVAITLRRSAFVHPAPFHIAIATRRMALETRRLGFNEALNDFEVLK